MIRPTRKRFMVLGFISLLVGGLALACSLWVKQEERQDVMNRQLIDALCQGDFQRSLKLVEAGADPNTRYKTTRGPSLPVLVRQLFHLPPPRPNYTPTALLIACGTPWNDTVGSALAYETAFHAQQNRPDASQLVDDMLQHGAKVNVRDFYNCTPLEYASSLRRYETVKVLVEHGADASSVIYDAVADQNIEIARFLIQHGANVNVQDLAGQTPLRLAQQAKRPDIVALLKRAGARK